MHGETIMTYNILEDIFYTNFISSKPNLTERSKDNYKKVLTKFTRAINTPLEKVVTDCKNQQDIVTEKIISHGTDEDGNQILEKTMTKFNVNSPNSKIKLYLDTFINYCKAQKNSNNTIKQNATSHLFLPDSIAFSKGAMTYNTIINEK